MAKVELNETEAVLFNAEVWAEGENFSEAEFFFTNERLIFKYKKREKIFKWVDMQDEYDVADVKIFNGAPQIIQKSEEVEIYLKNKQLQISFINKKEAHNFTKKVTELLTGKTAGKRAAEKIKGAIALVDDTLGIDTVQTATGVLKSGVTSGIKSVFSKESTMGKIVGFVSKGTEVLGASMLASRKEQKQIENREEKSVSLDDKVEQIKKCKELLDAGIISEEEFNAKKKEILGI